MKYAKRMTCPTKPRFEGDIIGCGSTNIGEPDHEGFYDCCNCGLFFNKESAGWARKPIPISASIRNMEEIVKRSHMLWLRVNTCILRVLKSRRSREQMAAHLLWIAGRAKKNEPTSLGNFRTAARQIKRGELVSVL